MPSSVAAFAGEARGFSPDGRFLVCDLVHARRIVRVDDGELQFSAPIATALVSPEGHLYTPTKPSGAAWATSPEINDAFVYVVQTVEGQQTLTPQEFANRYGWQNDPDKVRLVGP